MTKVLVTDGRSLAALAIVRSLGEKGFEVHCGDDFKNNLSSFSKYVTKRVIYPSPENQESEFISFLSDLSEREKYDLVIPVRDETTLLLAKYNDVFLKNTNLYLANFESVLLFRNKGETVKLALENNVPVPKTYFPENMSIPDIKTCAKYPILVRARISSGSRGIKYVSCPSEFEDAYHEIKSEYDEPMIQEYVSHEGGHYSIGTLFNKRSEPVATHVYKELKQYPLNGGPAVTAISVEKEDWVDIFLQMLKNIGWIGPAHMDVLYDTSSNSYRLLEVNPRFWMSLNLAVNSGVDFPHLLYSLAIGDEVDSVRTYDIGVKYRWVLPNEILWLLKTPHKVQGIREFINFWDKSTCYGVISTKDPNALFGLFSQGLDFLFNPEKRNLIFNRGWKGGK